MIVFLTLVYSAVLFLLIRLKVLPDTTTVKSSPGLFMLVLLVFLFIPMQWGAPSGPATAFTNSVQIVPNVSGEVIEIPIRANEPLHEGDVLFRIDPEPFEASLASLQAELTFARLRLVEYRNLKKGSAATQFEVEDFEAQVDRLEAQVRGAKYDLRETVVRAPSDGFVTYLGLRPGARVVNMPLTQAMAFIDTTDLILVAQVAQIFARNIETGQPAEVTFKFMPGQVYAATVVELIQATAQGQVAPGGSAVEALPTTPGPFFVRFTLDDPSVKELLPAGAMGTAAVYSEHVTFAHVIRRVMLRMEAWLNYVVPT